MQEYDYLNKKYDINCSKPEAEEACDFEDYSDGNQIDSYGDFRDEPENAEEEEQDELGLAVDANDDEDDKIRGRTSGYRYSGKSLTPEEEKELVRQARAGDELATEQLIMAQMGFITKQAATVLKTNCGFLDMNDLIQEGCEGVIKAIKNYDEDSNIHFGWYSTFYIKKNIIRAIYETGRHIRAPEYKIREWCAVRDEISDIIKKTDGEYIPPEEIIAQLKKKGIREASIKEVLDEEAGTTVFSFDALDDNGVPKIEAIKTPTKYKHWTNMSKEDIMFIREIEEAADKLSNVEKYVIEKYLGLEGDKRNLDEIAVMIGQEHSDWIRGKTRVSKERIRIIKDKAIDRINKILYNNSIVMDSQKEVRKCTLCQ